MCRHTGNKNAKRIIKRTTKVADLFEVVFVVGLKATMDAINVVCAVVAENMIIFCGKGVGVKCALE